MERVTENGRFNKKKPTWALLVGLTLVALLAGVATVSCGGAVGKQGAEESPGAGTQATAEKTQTGAQEAQAGADLGHPSLGEKDAPVLMIEHSDYQ
jgi:hypothetical protein